MSRSILPNVPTAGGVLRAALPRRHRAHAVARAARTSVDTARTWLSERFTPSADTLLRIAAENRAVRLELIRTLQEIESALMDDVAADGGGRVGDEVGGAVGQDRAAVVAQGATDRPAFAVGCAAGSYASPRRLGEAAREAPGGPGLTTRGRR